MSWVMRFNLPHPPGCDQPIPGVTCPYDALMYAEYASYPNTYLLPLGKVTLKSEAFFTSLDLPSDLPALGQRTASARGAGSEGSRATWPAVIVPCRARGIR